MNKLLITNARLINEGEIRDADVLIDGMAKPIPTEMVKNWIVQA